MIHALAEEGVADEATPSPVSVAVEAAADDTDALAEGPVKDWASPEYVKRQIDLLRRV